MKSFKLSVFILSTLFSTGMSAQNAPQLRADNIDEVINAMTTEEKAQMLVGGGNSGFVGSGAMLVHQKRIVAGAAGITVAIPRLGIPSTVLTDGPAGVHIDPTREGTNQTFYATGFPIGTCLASTWNQVGRCIGNETLEYGCDVVLGPGMNLHRSPLCGRNFEYYSEDPTVTGIIGTAMVKGIQSQGVGVSAKHFAVNSQESDRTRVNERLSQRALRELYLRGFEKMVRNSHPWTLMASYNRINGVYAQNNKELLTTILRDEWGFDGIVMTDWISIRPDLPTWTEPDAGDELLMPGYGKQAEEIVQAVKEGKLSEEVLNREVKRVLEYIVKTPKFHGYQFSNKPNLKAHAEVTRQSSTEGMVLLKNSISDKGVATLPLTKMKKVALFGVNSYDFLSGGLGSGCVNVPYVVDMKQGLKNVGVETTKQLTDIYESYIAYAKLKFKADKNPEMWFLDQGQPKLPEIEISRRSVETSSQEADAAIITIGRQAGEGLDRDIKTEFNLNEDEKSMIDRVSSVYHQAGKPVVVVINSGSVMETASWRDAVDAILVAWQPGEEGGNSVADVLTGKVNPSGHLTMTWPPFGFGLSYTTFKYSNLKASAKGNKVNVDVTVTNTGKTAGKQVAQIYVSAPKGNIQKPKRELKGFGKTRLLKPGESQTLHMVIDRRDLTSFDEANSQWLGEAGDYAVEVGDNIEDITSSVKVRLSEYTEKVHHVMKPDAQLNLLRQ